MVHPRHGDRLVVTPPLEEGDVTFLAGFAPRRGRVARIWPGQPAVPSPWLPCDQGCCLVLVPLRVGASRGDRAAGQWLRFLVEEFLGDRHRVDGWVRVTAPPGLPPVLLIVEAGDVFEGDLEETSQSSTPAARAGSA